MSFIFWFFATCLLASPTVQSPITPTERQLIRSMENLALKAMEAVHELECTFDNKDRYDPTSPFVIYGHKFPTCLRGRIYKASEKIPIVSPMVSRKGFNKTANEAKTNWPLSFFLSAGNSLWNLIKLIIYAPIVITANIIEGIAHRTSPWWPAQVALNAAWNIATLPLAFFNVIADPIWHALNPDLKSHATVNLLGYNKSLRLNVGGGLLGHASAKADGWTVSQGLLFTEYRNSPWPLLGHEYAHTEQIRDSFAVDFGLKYLFNRERREAIESKAEEQENKYVKNLWYVQ